MLTDLLFLIIKNLKQRKTRTILTTLGIIIGIAAVVGLVGATKGINESINKQLSFFRSNWIIIIPGKLKIGFMSGSLRKVNIFDESDLNDLERLPGIEYAIGFYQKTLSVTYEGETLYLQVWGVSNPEKFEKIDTIGVMEGRYISSNDKRSAFLGYSVAKEMFEEDITEKKKILLDGIEYKVVGVRNKYGGLMSNIEDTIVFVPLSTLREDFNLPEGLSYLILQKSEKFSSKEVEDEIRLLLCKKRKSCGNEDFTIITPEFVQDTVSSISSMLTVMLGSIAGISLLVGSIGIANTMYTSVLERTREIGILKSIGASSKTILLMFLLESSMLGLIGGIIGIFAGYAIGELFLILRYYFVQEIETFQQSIMTTHVVLTPSLVLGSILISILVGLIAGIFPARKASKLQPVEALRYE